MNKMVIKKELMDIAEGIGSALYLTSMVEDDELRHRFVLELSKLCDIKLPICIFPPSAYGIWSPP